jgi:hypothetical protein
MTLARDDITGVSGNDARHAVQRHERTSGTCAEMATCVALLRRRSIWMARAATFCGTTDWNFASHFRRSACMSSSRFSRELTYSSASA